MKNPIFKIFATYLVILLLLLCSANAFSQVSVIHFNADWNKANNVEWFEKLSDVDKKGFVEYAKKIGLPTKKSPDKK